jgi:hypothetical protein
MALGFFYRLGVLCAGPILNIRQFSFDILVEGQRLVGRQYLIHLFASFL